MSISFAARISKTNIVYLRCKRYSNIHRFWRPDMEINTDIHSCHRKLCSVMNIFANMNNLGHLEPVVEWNTNEKLAKRWVSISRQRLYYFKVVLIQYDRVNVSLGWCSATTLGNVNHMQFLKRLSDHRHTLDTSHQSSSSDNLTWIKIYWNILFTKQILQ